MNADACLMRFELRTRQETHIVGRDRTHAAQLRQFQRRFRTNLLTGAAGALYLEVKSIPAIFLPALKAPRSLFVAASCNRLTDVPFKSSREHDQSLQCLAAQPGALQHRRAAVLALEIRAGD